MARGWEASSAGTKLRFSNCPVDDRTKQTLKVTFKSFHGPWGAVWVTLFSKCRFRKALNYSMHGNHTVLSAYLFVRSMQFQTMASPLKCSTCPCWQSLGLFSVQAPISVRVSLRAWSTMTRRNTIISLSSPASVNIVVMTMLGYFLVNLGRINNLQTPPR